MIRRTALTFERGEAVEVRVDGEWIAARYDRKSFSLHRVGLRTHSWWVRSVNIRKLVPSRRIRKRSK